MSSLEVAYLSRKLISTIYFSLTGNETPQTVAFMESSANEIEAIARTGHSLVLSCICG